MTAHPAGSTPSRSGGSHALASTRNGLGPVPFSKQRAQARGSGNSQADHRMQHHMEDQHGRPWSCSVEIRSGMPTGLITNDFSAPWLPDQGALIVNPNKTSKLWIDYGLLWRERMQALGSYHKLAVQLATDKSWPIPKKGDYSNDYRRVLGDPPKPLQPVKAAAQGNPWILGFTDVVDARLIEHVTPLEERDADLDDGEDYSPDGFNAQVREQDALRSDTPLDDDAEEVYAPRAFAPPVVDLAEMNDETVEDYSGDDELGMADTPSDADDDPYAPRFPIGSASEPESALDVLDDVHDPAKLGGRTVQPQKTAIANRQAPRQPGARTGKKPKRGNRGRQMASLRASQAAKGIQQPKGATLAGGARPAVSTASSTNEVLVRHKSEA